MRDILYKVKYEYGTDCCTIVIYSVSIITNYSYGPIDNILITDIANKGGVIAKIVSV